jgi:hypothetical protein
MYIISISPGWPNNLSDVVSAEGLQMKPFQFGTSFFLVKRIDFHFKIASKDVDLAVQLNAI